VAEAAPAPVITGNQYSEAQHFSLLKSAVESETASLIAAKSELETRNELLESEKAALATELSGASARIDLLVAEKATVEAAATTARTELAEFKSEIARTAQIAELKDARKVRVQAANDRLPTGFFSEERITRWAEMANEVFDAFIVDMTEMAKITTATPVSTPAVRESAAFSGGITPTTTGLISTTAQLLGTRRAANR
jgi:hypothetical protein